MRRDNSVATQTRLGQNSTRVTSTRNVNESSRAQLNSSSTHIISSPNFHGDVLHFDKRYSLEDKVQSSLGCIIRDSNGITSYTYQISF